MLYCLFLRLFENDTSLIPRRDTSLIHRRDTSLIPRRDTPLIHRRDTSFIPGRIRLITSSHLIAVLSLSAASFSFQCSRRLYSLTLNKANLRGILLVNVVVILPSISQLFIIDLSPLIVILWVILLTCNTYTMYLNIMHELLHKITMKKHLVMYHLRTL